jgi:hypothetical protein
MTREEALNELDQLSRVVKAGLVSQQEVLCEEMKKAARILSIAFESVRKRDPLYGNIRRTGVLSPPPGACAARLMAPGAALAIPRLSRGSLDPFCPAGDRKSFLLAHTLLQTGIGYAQDWRDSHRDALQFMARIIERAAEPFDSAPLMLWRISTSRWERTRLARVGEIRRRNITSRVSSKQS